MLDTTTVITTAAEITVTAGDLQNALRRVRHAMSREETRYYLNGIYAHHIAADNALRFVATDGHRLAQMDIPASEGADGVRPAILSREFVMDASKATSKAVHHGGPRARSRGRCRRSTRLQSGCRPNRSDGRGRGLWQGEPI
jgi:DNA polymerase III sliding clamp (beta) subunit (PCNA family)